MHTPGSLPRTIDPTSSTAAVRVEVSNTQAKLAVDSDALARLVQRVLLGEGVRQARISLALVDDPTIHRINLRHLKHDWPTDVITFVLSDPDEPVLVGELVISAEMARSTALELQADSAAELALYVVHGLLHLCGYEDDSPEEIQRMRLREDEVLRGEGISNTFGHRQRQEHPGERRGRTTCSA